MLVADHELGDAVHGFELVVVRAPEPHATLQHEVKSIPISDA